MTLLNLAKEVAKLAGYSITGTDAQSVADKASAIRRINLARTKMASSFSGRWSSLYREGWLPLVPVYSTGTVDLTQGSRAVTGTNTVWTSSMVGRKFLGPDNAYYKIIAVGGNTSLTLSEPYQGEDVTAGVYQIWKDEYVLYPEVYSLIDFVNYIEPSQMREYTNRESNSMYTRSTANETPKYFTVLGRSRNLTTYATGTVSGTINTRTLTGSGTSWLSNLQPGYEILVTVSSTVYCYHVDTVDSDTQVTLVEDIAATISAGTSYSARGRNAMVVRFLSPSSQTIVRYSYYTKVYPLVNDYDEDWMTELYPHLLINEITKNDHLDKKDPQTAMIAAQLFEKDLADAHQADLGSFGGAITVALDIPDTARE